MKVDGNFVEPQGRAWVLVETGFGLGEELAGGGDVLSVYRCGYSCISLGEGETGYAQREGEEQREAGEDGRSSAAAAVAADARRQEVPGAGAELDAVGDHDPASAWPRAHRSPGRARCRARGLGVGRRADR